MPRGLIYLQRFTVNESVPGLWSSRSKGTVQALTNLRQMSFLRSVLKKIEPLSSRFA
jgi:hypothetical protein